MLDAGARRRDRLPAQAGHPRGRAPQVKLWRWDIDEAGNTVSRANGFTWCRARSARPRDDDGEVDGFVAIPAAALAFQW